MSMAMQSYGMGMGGGGMMGGGMGMGMGPGGPGPPTSLMAEQLARVFGTEEDPVNCAFYFKVGTCRHGDLCSKRHNRPTASRTLLLSHMYPSTAESLAIAGEDPWTEEMYDRAQAHVEAFYTEVVLVLADYGEIEEVVVVDNIVEYMLGNVYVKYYHEKDAERALQGLTGRFYFGKLIDAEYSPVTDFREARCRAFHETRCSRGGACRFLHIKHIPTAIKRRVARVMYDEHPEFKRNMGGGGGGGRDRRRQRERSPRRRRDDTMAIEDGGYRGGRGGRDAGAMALEDAGGRQEESGSRRRRRQDDDAGEEQGEQQGGDAEHRRWMKEQGYIAEKGGGGREEGRSKRGDDDGGRRRRRGDEGDEGRGDRRRGVNVLE